MFIYSTVELSLFELSEFLMKHYSSLSKEDLEREMMLCGIPLLNTLNEETILKLVDLYDIKEKIISSIYEKLCTRQPDLKLTQLQNIKVYIRGTNKKCLIDLSSYKHITSELSKTKI